MSAALNFDLLQTRKYVSLESFRKSGEGVRTPVWFAGEPDGGHLQTLYVYTEAESGKTKRIRRNARVRIAPCDMRGKVLGDWIEARAEIVTGEEARRGMRLLNAKYPLKWLFELISKFRRRERIMLAIRPGS